MLWMTFWIENINRVKGEVSQIQIQHLDVHVSTAPLYVPPQTWTTHKPAAHVQVNFQWASMLFNHVWAVKNWNFVTHHMLPMVHGSWGSDIIPKIQEPCCVWTFEQLISSTVFPKCAFMLRKNRKAKVTCYKTNISDRSTCSEYFDICLLCLTT